jgi:hypothetical protein
MLTQRHHSALGTGLQRRQGLRGSCPTAQNRAGQATACAPENGAEGQAVQALDLSGGADVAGLGAGGTRAGRDTRVAANNSQRSCLPCKPSAAVQGASPWLRGPPLHKNEGTPPHPPTPGCSSRRGRGAGWRPARQATPPPPPPATTPRCSSNSRTAGEGEAGTEAKAQGCLWAGDLGLMAGGRATQAAKQDCCCCGEARPCQPTSAAAMGSRLAVACISAGARCRSGSTPPHYHKRLP